MKKKASRQLLLLGEDIKAIKRFAKLVFTRDSLLKLPPGQYTISRLRDEINLNAREKGIARKSHFNTIKSLLFESALIQSTFPRIWITSEPKRTLVTLGLPETARELAPQEKIYCILYMTGALSPERGVNVDFLIERYDLDEALDTLLEDGYILEAESGKLFIPEASLSEAQEAVAKLKFSEAPVDIEVNRNLTIPRGRKNILTVHRLFTKGDAINIEALNLKGYQQGVRLQKGEEIFSSLKEGKEIYI